MAKEVDERARREAEERCVFDRLQQQRQALGLPADATERQCAAKMQANKNDTAISEQLWYSTAVSSTAEVQRLLTAGANPNWVRARAARFPTTQRVARPPFCGRVGSVAPPPPPSPEAGHVLSAQACPRPPAHRTA